MFFTKCKGLTYQRTCYSTDKHLHSAMRRGFWLNLWYIAMEFHTNDNKQQLEKITFSTTCRRFSPNSRKRRCRRCQWSFHPAQQICPEFCGMLPRPTVGGCRKTARQNITWIPWVLVQKLRCEGANYPHHIIHTCNLYVCVLPYFIYVYVTDSLNIIAFHICTNVFNNSIKRLK